MINRVRPYSRNNRIADSIKSILGEVFLNKLFLKQKGIITITNVTVSKDLRYSKVFITFLSNNGQAIDIIHELDQNKKFLRYHLGQKLPTKYVPEISFYNDDTMSNAFKINELIEKTKK